MFEIFGKVANLVDTNDYEGTREALDLVGELTGAFKDTLDMGYVQGKADGYAEGEQDGYDTAVSEYEADKTAEAE